MSENSRAVFRKLGDSLARAIHRAPFGSSNQVLFFNNAYRHAPRGSLEALQSLVKVFECAPTLSDISSRQGYLRSVCESAYVERNNGHSNSAGICRAYSDLEQRAAAEYFKNLEAAFPDVKDRIKHLEFIVVTAHYDIEFFGGALTKLAENRLEELRGSKPQTKPERPVKPGKTLGSTDAPIKCCA
jgi:hypothetical protein